MKLSKDTVILGLQKKNTELNEKIEHNTFLIGTLNNKIDAVEARLTKRIDEVDGNLSRRIDAVAADLAAHRADTEAHHGVYRVKESGS